MVQDFVRTLKLNESDVIATSCNAIDENHIYITNKRCANHNNRPVVYTYDSDNSRFAYYEMQNETLEVLGLTGKTGWFHKEGNIMVACNHDDPTDIPEPCINSN